MTKAADRQTLLHWLAADTEALLALNFGHRTTICERIRAGCKTYAIPLHNRTDPVRLIASWATSSSCPTTLKNALTAYQDCHKKKRTTKTQFLLATRLHVSPGKRNFHLRSVPVITVSSLKRSYPPYGTIIANNKEIFDQWYPHFASGKQADTRMKRLPLKLLDSKRLRVDLKPHESALFVDEKGKLVGVVLRNFCPNQALLDWAIDEAKKQIPLRRNIRVLYSLRFTENTKLNALQKEDTGKLVLMGYSAGARSKMQFDWVRNITKKMDDASKDQSNAAGSVLFAVAWQLMKSQVPSEIIQDFDDYIESINIDRMDRGHCAVGSTNVVIRRSSTTDGKETLGVSVEGQSFEFHNVELAPPAGVIGQNYSR
ncbi:hypothetical protein H0H93_010134 [Arthromyces matolae]|nr:hypothetical protein H0H93_010134 [Arthromyces matolae]